MTEQKNPAAETKMSDVTLARCRSSVVFERQFPSMLKRNRAKHLNGTVLRRTSSPDLFLVRWDGYKTAHRLHVTMFNIAEPWAGKNP